MKLTSEKLLSNEYCEREYIATCFSVCVCVCVRGGGTKLTEEGFLNDVITLEVIIYHYKHKTKLK